MGRYEIARQDFETLETIAPLDDQVELDARREELMRCPTKAKAADMYESAIRLWFREHVDAEGVDDIRERHNI